MPETPRRRKMTITRIYTGADRHSHFESMEIELKPGGEIGWLSAPLPVAGLIFRENDADYEYDWHCAPRRQFIVMLDGEIEIEVSDGTIRQFRSGQVLLVEDTAGRGHRTRNIGGTARHSLFLPLA